MRNIKRFFIIPICFLLVVFFNVPSAFASGIAADPVISRNLPAYTSDDCVGTKPASLANDNSYDTYWRSCNATPSASVPVTLSYDLSGVATASRKNVIVAWYNDSITGAYDHTLINVNAYNTPKDYTVQANAGTGGGSPPASGWVTLVTVTGNHYHSRQHQVDLTGYNWVRLSFTASDGTDSSNQDIAVNMDIHDVSSGIADDYIFYGDSITQQGFEHINTYASGIFSQAINTFNSSYFPIYESGGIGGFTSADGAANINTWLPLFPGKFVALNYGTNDANGLVSGTTFYNNMKTMVQAVINVGKVPIIPKIPWGCTANITSDVGTLNAQIDQLYTDFSQIIKGPDLYTFFNAHQSDISGDCIHPTDPQGYTDYMTQWVNSMETAIYTLPVVTASPSGENISSAQSVTLTSTKTGTIYYTTDGSTPTTASSVYSSPLTILSTTTVKTIAVDKAGNTSSIVSQTYTFSGSTSTSVSPATITSSTSSPNPNIHVGWSKEVMAGPNYVGITHFITGQDNAMTFIGNDATSNDVSLSITKSALSDLQQMYKPIPFPWEQGFNTASDIYNYSAVSAFNGYPILNFIKPVTIILPYDPTKLTSVSNTNVKIAYFDSKIYTWKLLQNPVVINTTNHTIATTTSTFSYFVVVYPRFTENNTTEVHNITKQITIPVPIQLPEISRPSPVIKSNRTDHSSILNKKTCLLFICW